MGTRLRTSDRLLQNNNEGDMLRERLGAERMLKARCEERVEELKGVKMELLAKISSLEDQLDSTQIGLYEEYRKVHDLEIAHWS